MSALQSIKKINEDTKQTNKSTNSNETLDTSKTHQPFINIAKQAGGSFTLEVDLPGVQKEDINLKC